MYSFLYLLMEKDIGQNGKLYSYKHRNIMMTWQLH